MKTFAYIDKNNYCTHIVQKQNDDNNGILINGFDKNYIDRKYDAINKVWLDEYKEITPINIDTETLPPTIQEQMQVQLEYVTCLLELQNGL